MSNDKPQNPGLPPGVPPTPPPDIPMANAPGTPPAMPPAGFPHGQPPRPIAPPNPTAIGTAQRPPGMPPTAPVAPTAPKILSPKEAFQQALSMGDSDGPKIGGQANHSAELASCGSNVIDFVSNVIENAITLGISDIHFEPFDNTARLRYRGDGILREVPELSDFLHENYSAVSTRVKILSSLDISERRLPQDGAIQYDYKQGTDLVNLRVSILPTTCGERIVMRVMDKSALNMPIDKLGFSEDCQKKLLKAIKSPQGMILVTGPTGSGKSTTLYAVLNALNSPEVNLMTAEDPVEFDVEGIGQVHVKDSIGLTFTAALRSFLRQDPEVIMVGEIRDKDTGDIAVKASLTGHLVLSTLHTNDAPSTVTRLINMGIPAYLITSSLTLVVAQRLARKICTECKIEDPEGKREQLLALGFTEEELADGSVKAYKGKGCSACMDTGSKGRRAIHEVLVVTRNLKEAILAGANDLELGTVAKNKDGFESMQDVGKRLIKEGILTIEEFKRVLMVED
ncbi:MAG: GspE/PulE family protein [Rickettsiales bacterium]|nr:GspE/PulE family protein [Pseudomonadota bacterium]MDA0966096.1 GspE/PulE family protein [Pseudomonadota bacterium]MDG4543239.1 GspE/PulE family protein [Rickettsiales bacterium]MDG4545437.1 GspE/PulE family protein [Rickettsiales bacterium]MDG4547886.1 GspE/PulE family protein [Rickettsiales bacterium]